MTRLVFLLSLSMFALIAYSQENTLTKKEKKEGWVLLFDGKTANGWTKFDGSPFPQKGWEISNGILTIHENQNVGDIVTNEEFSDFEFTADFKIGTACNSGIKYFYYNYPKGGRLGMEYQVLDDKDASDNKLANHLCGSLYDVFPANESIKKVNPLGEWNTAKIVSKGKHVEHWLNGIKILEFERGSADYLAAVAKSKYKSEPVFGMIEKGKILLQDHGHEASFRNIKIRKL